MRRQLLTAVAGAALATGLAAAPSSAATAATDTTPIVKPLINQRPCNSNELPRQIWLYPPPSSIWPTRCYGGTVGTMSLGTFPVQWLSSGDYTGTIECVNGLVWHFNPGEDRLLNTSCVRLTIRHGS